MLDENLIYCYKKVSINFSSIHTVLEFQLVSILKFSVFANHNLYQIIKWVKSGSKGFKSNSKRKNEYNRALYRLYPILFTLFCISKLNIKLIFHCEASNSS